MMLRYFVYVIEGAVLTPLLVVVAMVGLCCLCPIAFGAAFFAWGWKIAGGLVGLGMTGVLPILALLHDGGRMKHTNNTAGLIGLATTFLFLVWAWGITPFGTIMSPPLGPPTHWSLPRDTWGLWALAFWIMGAMLGSSYVTGWIGAALHMALHARVMRLRARRRAVEGCGDIPESRG